MNPSDPGDFSVKSWLEIGNDFLKAYYASLHPKLREILKRQQSSAAREAQLRDLAIAEGVAIDRQIMIDLWHPYWTMLNRFNLGIEAVGSAYGSGAIRVVDPRDPSQWPAPYPEPPRDATDWVSSSNVEGFEGSPYFEPTVEGRAIPIGYFLAKEDGHAWIKMGPGAIPGGPHTAYGFWMKIG